jgi:hypothetical protein
MARKHTDTPPYVPKKGLIEILEQIQIHKEGDLIEGEELHKRGVSKHLIYPAMAALRFLGLLDQTDHLIGHHKIFSREKPDRDAQKKVVRDAYCDFFENAVLPLESDDVLKSRFQEIYGLSERLMNSSFPLFEYLAEGSGITLCHKNNGQGGSSSVSAADAGRDPGNPGAHPSRTEGEFGEDEAVAKTRHGGVQVVVTIQVSKYTNEKDIIKMVKTAKRAVHLLKKSGDSHF